MGFFLTHNNSYKRHPDVFPLCFCCRKGLHSAQPQLLADYMFFLQLNEMLRNPGEGHFWQVDHIKPVYEGGGQCSLDNLQTLCTVCHREVSDNHTSGLVQAALGGACTHGWARLEQMWGASWHWLCGSAQSQVWGGCYPLQFLLWGCGSVGSALTDHSWLSGHTPLQHSPPNLNLAFADF